MKTMSIITILTATLFLMAASFVSVAKAESLHCTLNCASDGLGGQTCYETCF